MLHELSHATLLKQYLFLVVTNVYNPTHGVVHSGVGEMKIKKPHYELQLHLELGV